MGSFLLGVFLAVAVALGIVRLFRFPIQWTGYVAVGLLAAGVYLYSLLEAKENPWTLWKRSWMQDAGDAEQHKLAKYATRDDCLKDQWKRLEEELERQKQVNQTIRLPGFHRVYLVEERTVFQFAPSLYLRMPDLKTRALADLSEMKKLTPYQKEQLAYEMLLPEIVATTSFFCTPSLKYGFWPYYTPTYYAATDDLRSLGEKTLAARAKKMLGE